MSATLMLVLVATMIATSFLSGIFGMAGGLILMGVLLALLPLPEAMALHAMTQMASNGWRGLSLVAACALARGRRIPGRLRRGLRSMDVLALRTVEAYSLHIAWGIAVSCSVGAVRAEARSGAPPAWRPRMASACMTLMLLAGVSGPLIDAYFLGGNLERRQIVATKAVCQIFSHGAKFVYFGGLVGQAAGLDPLMAGFAIAASITGTSLARPILERLSDAQYRRWAIAHHHDHRRRLPGSGRLPASMVKP